MCILKWQHTRLIQTLFEFRSKTPRKITDFIYFYFSLLCVWCVRYLAYFCSVVTQSAFMIEKERRAQGTREVNLIGQVQQHTHQISCEKNKIDAYRQTLNKHAYTRVLLLI